MGWIGKGGADAIDGGINEAEKTTRMTNVTGRKVKDRWIGKEVIGRQWGGRRKTAGRR